MPERPEQRVTLGEIVRDLYMEYRRVLQRELQPLNVSLSVWVFLRILWREDGLTQKALSARVGYHPSSAVDTLRVMEREGLVERHPDPIDGRALRVFLTRKARALRPELMRCADRVNDIAVADLTDADITALRRLLTKMLSNLEQPSR